MMNVDEDQGIHKVKLKFAQNENKIKLFIFGFYNRFNMANFEFLLI